MIEFELIERLAGNNLIIPFIKEGYTAKEGYRYSGSIAFLIKPYFVFDAEYRRVGSGGCRVMYNERNSQGLSAFLKSLGAVDGDYDVFLDALLNYPLIMPVLAHRLSLRRRAELELGDYTIREPDRYPMAYFQKTVKDDSIDTLTECGFIRIYNGKLAFSGDAVDDLIDKKEFKHIPFPYRLTPEKFSCFTEGIELCEGAAIIDYLTAKVDGHKPLSVKWAGLYYEPVSFDSDGIIYFSPNHNLKPLKLSDIDLGSEDIGKLNLNDRYFERLRAVGLSVYTNPDYIFDSKKCKQYGILPYKF